MRNRIAMLAAFMTVSSIVVACLTPGRVEGTTMRKISASPNRQQPPTGQVVRPAVGTAGVFRVTLNGFTVVRETVDNMFETDGKRDEVYIVAEVWVRDKRDNITYRRSLKSKVMGDTNNFPDRIKAGSASDRGGLRTGDSFPSQEPWRRLGDPRPDRVPMLLWEGELVRGENVVIIHPTIWEWDGPDFSQYEKMWVASREYGDPRLSLALPSIRDGRAWPVSSIGNEMSLGGGLFDGNRPIGLGFRAPKWFYLPRAIFTLTYDTALQAIGTSETDKGLGIFSIQHEESLGHGLDGFYILYVQVERVR